LTPPGIIGKVRPEPDHPAIVHRYRAHLVVAASLAVGIASAGEHLASTQADVETVLAVRAELVDAVHEVAARHRVLERLVASVRDGVHPASLAIDDEREALASFVAVRRTAIDRRALALRADGDSDGEWLVAQRDELAVLHGESEVARAVYLTAKGEHDDLAAELGQLVAEFNAAADAFNAQEPGARSAGEAELLRALEDQIAQGRQELARRRDQALDLYEIMVSADRAWREARSATEAERDARGARLTAAGRELEQARVLAEDEIEAEAAVVRRRIARLESAMHDEIAARRSERDAALGLLESTFGERHEALRKAIDGWLDSSSVDALYAEPGRRPRFDRSLPRVDALYSAIERLTAPRPAPALRVIEERG
jgi:hypothetical protein